MDVVSSTPVMLWVDFEAPQGLVIPDVGTTSFTLYDGSGVPLIVQQGLTPEAQATGVSIPIPAINNILAPDRAFERRQVIASWVSGGRSYSARQTYRVIDPPNYSATAEDVRTYLAINSDELRDDEVDLFSAYQGLAQVVGADRLAAALDSGTALELRAERAIILTAASSLFASLRYRILQAKTDGTLKVERIKDAAAFDSLVAATIDELAGFVAEVTGNTSAQDVVPFLIGLTIITTDPVTGNAPATGG